MAEVARRHEAPRSLAMEEPARNKAAEASIESVVSDAVIWAGHDVDAGHLSRVIRDVRGAQ
ncbi:hypothetical protein [Mesorhizobium sp.]|uniref:hypothetical protein n=1 Tax=Mesorhizobium sp. TaxID=1871066 RepID=UPI0025F0FA05|nr:hypothetical protein [Mesorhizobium sp.]